MVEQEIHALADRLLEAIEAGDIDAVASCYADDAVIWHNTDDRTQDVARNAKVLEAMDRFVTDRRYTDRRVTAFDGGAVQQHVLRGTRRSTGEEVALHACVVIAVDDDGRISRLDEYFDSAEAARFA